MIKNILLTLVAVFYILTASAQDLSVRSMETLTMDTYASVHKRVDNNGTACAVVRVSLPLAGVTFSGNVMGDVQRDGSDYLVYMPAGSKKLWVKHPNFYELEVVFGSYGIDRLQSLITYRVTINVPQMGSAVQQDNGMTYFILNVQPKNAQVSIDGNPLPIDANGDYSILLPRGSHSYTLTAGGYETKTETFMLGTERKRVDVSLVSNMASLTINAATAGTQIYVNEQNRGTTRWTGQVLPGNYVIEGRLDGYYPHKQTITIANRQQQTISIPALVARTGSLDVSYKPSDSEVWIDGKKVGMSPDIFNGIIMGSHKVSIRKDGYTTKDVTVNITEGQTASLTGALEQNASSSASSSSSSFAVGGAQTFTVKGVSFNMIPVQGGTFTMGATSEMTNPDNDEKPTHQVTLSSYSIGETEVTQALWEAVMGMNYGHGQWENKYGLGANYPAYRVSWDDCQEFITKLNQLTGKRFRLPTEAEWEYAARGGNNIRHTQYSGSSNLAEVAWYSDNSSRMIHSVKTKKANELGIYDMTGNVWEWCQDWYGKYNSNSQNNPTGATSGSCRVRRGGCWYDNSRYCRSSYRGSSTPDNRSYNLGLRLVLSE